MSDCLKLHAERAKRLREFMADVTNVLNQISTAPSGNEAFNAWLGTEDAVAFLKNNAQQDELDVYAVVQCKFMQGDSRDAFGRFSS